MPHEIRFADRLPYTDKGKLQHTGPEAQVLATAPQDTMTPSADQREDAQDEAPASLAGEPAASEIFSPVGELPLTVIDLDQATIAALRETCALAPRSGVRIGVDRGGAVPGGVADLFDILLTTGEATGKKWVRVAPEDLDREIGRLSARAAATPFAASVFAQVLRMGASLSFDEGLILESFAYSTLLAGGEFHAWRAANPARRRSAEPEHLVDVERERALLRISLNRPAAHNGLNARMRDQLAEALRAAVADPMISRILLKGEGPSFCSGGDLDEFGSATDQALAHAVRIARSVSSLVHRCTDRVSVRLHGACLGAGIEIAAAAGSITADRSARLGLPEVGMGLIPGAGGTVTVRRRIGRHRTCYLGLSSHRLTAEEALAWGLIDGLEDCA
ncbi:enoyl-CoA hydratase/isomerase family protein [Emcibacter sp. SYSU 3D8]|uniref:enoyl-CoA hydratase/isomerase family protein n=1 Tax=Emcibacter sp. SYSU 3D8 TaxID=3133969 RepID=UPI0031FEAB3F